MADVELGMPKSEVPYPPSWMDRLVAWIDGLPGPVWLSYTLIFAALLLLDNGIMWIDGGLPFGVFDPVLSLFALYIVYWVPLYQVLTRVATRSLNAFRPLLDLGDAEIRGINYRLVVLPRNLGLVAIVAGILLSVLSYPGDLEDYIGPIANQARTDLPVVYYIAASAVTGITSLALIARTIRQLRLVSELHEQATSIDLLDLDPPHAFSGLTARTGLGIVILLIISSFQGPIDEVNLIDLITYGAFTLFAIVVFVVPLVGMRNRLEAEKHRGLRRVSRLLHAARDHLYRAVEDDRFEAMGGINDAIDALLRQRALLEKTSTWPWNPGTLRGFASTLLLPIFLWLITRLLERML